MKYGLVCISKKFGGFKTITWQKFNSMPRQQAIEILSQRIQYNLENTLNTLKYCADNNWNYRLSSSLFPILTHPLADFSYNDLPNRGTLDKLFQHCARVIRDNGIRVGSHPSQYVVLESDKAEVVKNSIIDLEFHGWLHDKLELPQNHSSPINIHIVSSQGTKQEIYERFVNNFNKLSDSVKNRLTLENSDKGIWNADSLYDYFYLDNQQKFVLCFDNLHYKCNDNKGTEEDYFNLFYHTWPADIIPLFHYSESSDNKNPRHHADLPLDKPKFYGKNVDMEIELKGKEEAIKKL